MNMVNTHHQMFLKKWGRLYCSKCGKAVMQDEYNRRRHASECGFHWDKDLTAIVQDGLYYAYSFLVENDKLIFLVSKLVLWNRPGFEDKFRGSVWQEVFRASFVRNSHEIEEEGLYNVDVWMKKFIDQQHLACLQPDRGVRAIHEYFPEIMDIHRFGTFLDTYRQRGYSRKTYDVRRELEEPLNGTVREIIRENKEIAVLAVSEFEKEGEMFLVLDLGWSSSRIIISKDFLVSREPHVDLSFLEGIEKHEYAKNWKAPKIEILEYPYGGILQRFARKYPSFMLAEYQKGGGNNPLVPLLSPVYDHSLELLAKAGLGKICGFYRFVCDQPWFHAEETDIRRMMGLPVKVLKRLQDLPRDTFVAMMPIYAQVYGKKPQFLQVEQFSDAYNDMLRYNDVCRDGGGEAGNGFDGFGDWSDRLILQTLRYLSGCSGSREYVTYKDYIRMCRLIQSYPDGRFPKNLDAAHDHALRLYHLRKNEYQNREFMAAVEKEEYARLATDYKEEEEGAEKEQDRAETGRKHTQKGKEQDHTNKKRARKEKEQSSNENKEECKERKEDCKDNSEEKTEEVYEVLTPSSMWDLVKESEKLHHCVRIYTDAVKEGRTYILFLRRREDRDKPFATMEVVPPKTASRRNDGLVKPTLIQLKAVNNTKAPADAQQFVCRWAREKGVRIDTRDMDERIIRESGADHPAA
ncbi:MAG: PcfJ domain-containing protein [Clostridiales bacterium]|nr:PcfJ domain-containing protein [Clostridiales bacterium]